jgi:vacuolar-type H+-ATPase subunit H
VQHEKVLHAGILLVTFYWSIKTTALQPGTESPTQTGCILIKPDGGEDTLNEKRIQQVLEIEKQADAIHAQAVSQAAQLPQQAEQEAQTLIEKSRQTAQEEARKIVADAQCDDECQRILHETEERVKNNEVLAMSNFNRAVNYVLARVVGRE